MFWLCISCLSGLQGREDPALGFQLHQDLGDDAVGCEKQGQDGENKGGPAKAGETAHQPRAKGDDGDNRDTGLAAEIEVQEVQAV